MGLSWPHKHVKARKALQFYHRPAMARSTYQQGLFLLTPSTGRPVRRSNVALAPGFLDWKQIWASQKKKSAIAACFDASRSLERQSLFSCMILAMMYAQESEMEFKRKGNIPDVGHGTLAFRRKARLSRACIKWHPG